MSGYLVAIEADDGVWFDEPLYVVGIDKAHKTAEGMSLPKGYDAVIYRLEYVNRIENKTTTDQPKN